MSRKKPAPKKASRPKEEKRWLSLPRLEGVKWVWADNWYDWVLTGVVEHNGSRYYAVCVDEDYGGRRKWYRRYLVIDLPKDVWAEEQERHDFFVEKVGSHFEFDGSGRKDLDQNLKPSHTWKEFYERYPTDVERDYKQYQHIGWFEN